MAEPVNVLDKYYLAITFLITVGWQLSGFAIAWTCQFDKITDITGGTNFFLLSLFTLLIGQTFHARNIVASTLVMVWAVRLGGFLLFRVLMRGSDSRFDDIRAKFFSFLTFWIAQILWVWICSMPVTILNSPAVSNGSPGPDFGTAGDIVGIILWAIGWIIESVADTQKYMYKSSNPPKDVPMQTGLWAWSRHPPYFGDILCWWGIWFLCISPSTHGNTDPSTRSAQLGSVVSPLFTILVLMFFSGIPTASKPQAKRYFLLSRGPDAAPEYGGAWKNYQEYVNSTSVLIPIPKSIYRPLPRWLKQTLLLDFPIYHFDEKTDGARALQEEEQRAR